MTPFDGALLLRSAMVALTIGVFATALALPAAWALRRLGATGSALLLAPMLVPSHLVYAAWGLLRAPGTRLGDSLAALGSNPDTGPAFWENVNMLHAIGALSLWAWPIAALVLSIWTRPIERDAIDAMRISGAPSLTISKHMTRIIAPGLFVSMLLVSALMLGSAIPLHLSQQRTYALVIWSEIAQGNAAGAWRASWPLFGIAIIAGSAVTIAIARGGGPAQWHRQGRDTSVRMPWLATAGVIWCLSTIVPLGIVAVSIKDWSTVIHFWGLAGERAAASAKTTMSVIVICGCVCVMCARGYDRAAGRAMRLCAIGITALLAVLFFTPGVLIGGILAASGTTPGLSGLIVAHVARFGLVAALAGALVARSESRELHEVRTSLGGGVGGWMRTVLFAQAGLTLGALGAVALLSMHEIESAVLLAQAGHATLSQYMLDLLHYFRTDEMLAALLWMQSIGLALAVGVALLTLHGWMRFVRRAGAVAPVMLALIMIGGCDHERPTTDSRALDVVRILSETGRGPGQLVFPRAIDTDGHNLWIIDKTARVQRFGVDGEIGPRWTMPRQDRGRPCGVTCGKDGLIYIADTHEHRVAIYRPTDDGGELVRTIGRYGTGQGEFVYPTDIAITWNPDGITPKRFYVSEYGGNDRISVFDSAWSFLFEIRGDGELDFARPQSIAFDDTLQHLVVIDASHHRVGVFTPDGELVRWHGKRDGMGPIFGNEPGKFSQPFGLALLGDGTALITEVGAQRVQRIDLNSGACLGVYGRGGWGEDELIQPWGITVVGKTAYVLDSGKDRVVAFRHGGVAPQRAPAFATSVQIRETAAQ